jgi:hypothetical protein
MILWIFKKFHILPIATISQVNYFLGRCQISYGLRRGDDRTKNEQRRKNPTTQKEKRGLDMRL